MKKINNNSGVALITAILITLILSLLGIGLVTVTYSFLEQSMFFSDMNKAYFLAEAGADRVTSKIDQMVGDIYEDAKTSASAIVANKLIRDPNTVRDADGNINSAEYDSHFQTAFFVALKEKLDAEFGNINATTKQVIIMDGGLVTGAGVYVESTQVQGRIYLQSSTYDKTTDVNRRYIDIVIRGERDDLKNRVAIKLDLIPSLDYPYNSLENVKTKKTDYVDDYAKRPDYLKKALVAQGDIIVTGDATVTGDILSFGTLPQSSITPSAIDDDADWTTYGGVLVGMSPAIYDNYSTTMQAIFDIDAASQVAVGDLTVKSTALDPSTSGNVATFGHLNILSGNASNESIVTIDGDVFARSVMLSDDTYHSQLTVNKDLNFIDTLSVGGLSSQAIVMGDLFGFVDAGWRIDGSSSSSGLDADFSKPVRTSNVKVGSEDGTKLTVNRGMYIGGSNFLGATDGNHYMTGVSVLEETSNLFRAFAKHDSPTFLNPSNPNNNFYYYNAGYTTYSSLTAVKPVHENYNITGGALNLVTKLDAAPVTDRFSLVEKAMHLKQLWLELWKDSENYSEYISSGNIVTSTSGVSFSGFSQGAVFANNTIYGIMDSTKDANYFSLIQKTCIQNYYNAMKTFIKDTAVVDSTKLTYVRPQKELDEYLVPDFVGTGSGDDTRIQKNVVYPLSGGRGFVYYADGDVSLTMAGINFQVDGITTTSQGLIFTEGNVFIKDGVNFKGVIAAKKNIVLTGTVNITYDKTVMNNLFDLDQITGDVNITGLFDIISYEVGSTPKPKNQRLKTTTIDVIEFRRVTV